jgi:hypothetical protein
MLRISNQSPLRLHQPRPCLTFAPLAWLKLQYFCHAGATEVGGFGGNIEVCCQRAVQYQLTLVEAAPYVRPTPTEDIEQLRQWASGICLSASTPGLYRRHDNGRASPSRRVHRGPSNN